MGLRSPPILRGAELGLGSCPPRPGATSCSRALAATPACSSRVPRAAVSAVSVCRHVLSDAACAAFKGRLSLSATTIRSAQRLLKPDLGIAELKDRK